LDVEKLRHELELLQTKQANGEELVQHGTIQDAHDSMKKRKDDFIQARNKLYSGEAKFL